MTMPQPKVFRSMSLLGFKEGPAAQPIRLFLSTIFVRRILYRSGDLLSAHVAHDRPAIDRTMRDGIGE